MRSTIQFAVRCEGPSGGALKVRDYFEHILASRFAGRVRLCMPADTPWRDDNPWLRHRERAAAAIDWTSVGTLVISGWGWERFVPEEFHRAPPFRVVYLVQSFGCLDARDSRFRHLANPAIRICVSRPLADRLRRLDVANGPVYTIPAAVDVRDVPADVNKDIGVLVVGVKRVEVARDLAAVLRGRGIASTLHVDKCARGEFLRRLARARVAVCLPAVTEGFYLPALEAMAAGAIAVCPDVLGNDYCRGGFNCLTPAYDVNSLAAAVESAVALSPRDSATMLDNALRTVRRHDPAAERERFLKVLRDAVPTPAPGAPRAG